MTEMFRQSLKAAKRIAPMATERTFPLIALSRLRMEIDGEGVTTLVAGSCCPLACKWCINASALKKEPENVSTQELFERVKCDDLYFQASGGGLTFGGGESLLYTDFISEFRTLIGCRWHLYAETSLAVAEENIRLAAEVIDGFIVDIKDMNPEIYRAYTGGNAEKMERNLRLLLSLAGPERVLVRVPLIPQYNTESDCEKSVQKLKEMGVMRFDRFTYRIKNDT